ncbi:MAG: 23S rRNA (pseudouridine(1915)-N(3))-methyltransferase RlmH [Myxococcota bacterium]
MLTLIAVGRDRNDPLVVAAQEYVQRIRRWIPTSVIEVREEPLRRTRNPEEVRRAEGQRILQKVPAGHRVIALEPGGRGLSSEAWAEHLWSWVFERKRGLVFVVGGPVGLSMEVLQRSDETRSLGPMTLPHRLARLIVAEQLYRAMTILHDEPYHK